MPAQAEEHTGGDESLREEIFFVSLVVFVFVMPLPGASCLEHRASLVHDEQHSFEVALLVGIEECAQLDGRRVEIEHLAKGSRPQTVS